jgi:competence protein ComEA
MVIEEIAAKLMPFIKKYWLPLVLAALGLIFFAYGLISLLVNKPQPQEMLTRSDSSESLASSPQNQITIDIEGAVALPGVYKLPVGSIIQDAFVAARGLSEDANRNFVAKNINLAGRLTDGQKIYIPHLNETDSQTQNASVNTVSVNAQSGLININSASSVDLDTLPGVGSVTAQKIIDNRPYLKIDDLLNRKVVSSKVFTGIKDRISTN